MPEEYTVKIIYLAKHDSGGNDDEGAIAHALEELGHSVIRLPEGQWPTSRGGVTFAIKQSPDLFLFHKWPTSTAVPTLDRLYGVCPRVFWYPDLVDWVTDPGLANRCAARRAWMAEILPHVDHGFCTDGDWVANAPVDQSPAVRASALKLHWLPQGADGRLVALGSLGGKRVTPPPPLLFTGISKGGGIGREDWVDSCRAKFGDLFNHVRVGTYREGLRDLIGRSAVVLCPDSPVTSRYWSNRVYNAAGFGGCVLHPYCDNLMDQYEDGTEIVMYSSRTQMYNLADKLLNDRELREAVGVSAMERTKAVHLYRHRVARLLEVATGAKQKALT